jgi:hypothetical protein
MKLLPSLLFFATAATAFPAAYSVKYDDTYSYVVTITGGKLNDIFIAERSEKGLAKIPQTVRIEGSNFSILCDLHMKGPGGTGGIALANLKGEVQLAKNSAPKIGKNTGVPLKE